MCHHGITQSQQCKNDNKYNEDKVLHASVGWITLMSNFVIYGREM